MKITPDALISFYYQAGSTTFTGYKSFADYDLAMSDIVEGPHTNHVFYRRGNPDEILVEVKECFKEAVKCLRFTLRNSLRIPKRLTRPGRN